MKDEKISIELEDLVLSNTRKTAFEKWSVEDVRVKMNILYVGKDCEREIYVYKDYSYTDGHPGYIFFSLHGSPQKMSAVYNYNNMTMTFLTSYGGVKEIWSNVCITNLKDLPDRCSVHTYGKIMDTEKHKEFDESNFHNCEDHREDIKDEYERKIEELLYLRNEEKIILFQHKDSYYTNEITICEYGDTHIWMYVHCGNYKLKKEIVNKILEINKKYEQFAEHSFELSSWGFTTFSIEESKYNDFKEEIEEIILDMDNYLHDLEG